MGSSTLWTQYTDTKTSGTKPSKNSPWSIYPLTSYTPDREQINKPQANFYLPWPSKPSNTKYSHTKTDACPEYQSQMRLNWWTLKIKTHTALLCSQARCYRSIAPWGLTSPSASRALSTLVRIFPIWVLSVERYLWWFTLPLSFILAAL